jgi:hypothetical protein
MHAVARLPQLTELDVSWGQCYVCIPVSLFLNLSKLSVSCGWGANISFIPQMATAIANSPHLRSLHARYFDYMARATLSDLFAEVSTKNPLCLEHLSIEVIDATVTQVTLPHLRHLTSFEFDSIDEDLSRRVWTSFRFNNIRLSDVVIRGFIIKEAMLYLSSFSGLKRLIVGGAIGRLENILFVDVLPKHVNSLRMLDLQDWVGHPIMPSLFAFSLTSSC